MHSTEEDAIDAHALVDEYIRFGDAGDAIPEMSRPVIDALVSEVLGMSRKEQYADLSLIADICAEPGLDSVKLERIAITCRDRLNQLSGKLHREKFNPDPLVPGRFPARHAPSRSGRHGD